jgi:predicted RNase H-like nuclease (RuvC/YqgF family)
MSFWKTFCTCAGCVIGAVCIIASGGTATPLVVAAAVGAGGVGGHLLGTKIEKDQKKVKNKEKELQIKDQTIQSIRKENETKQAEIDQLKQRHEQIQEQKEQTKKDLENAKNKANDSSLSEDEKKYWRNRVIELENKLNQTDEEDKDILKRIGELQDQISNNNKTISSVGSSSYGKDKGVWEYITLENILIAFAVYALWQIIKEDRR